MLFLQEQYLKAKKDNTVNLFYDSLNVLVQNANANDFPLIDSLVEETYAPHLVTTSSSDSMETKSYARHLRDSERRADHGSVLVLTVSGDEKDGGNVERLVVGTITVIKVDDENTPYRKIGAAGQSELRFNAVADDYQGLGFSKLLMKHARNTAFYQHFSSEMVAATMPTMDSAQELYRKSGMTRKAEMDHIGFDGRTYPGFVCMLTGSEYELTGQETKTKERTVAA